MKNQLYIATCFILFFENVYHITIQRDQSEHIVLRKTWYWLTLKTSKHLFYILYIERERESEREREREMYFYIVVYSHAELGVAFITSLSITRVRFCHALVVCSDWLLESSCSSMEPGLYCMVSSVLTN